MSKRFQTCENYERWGPKQFRRRRFGGRPAAAAGKRGRGVPLPGGWQMLANEGPAGRASKHAATCTRASVSVCCKRAPRIPTGHVCQRICYKRAQTLASAVQACLKSVHNIGSRMHILKYLYALLASACKRSRMRKHVSSAIYTRASE